MIKCEHHGGYFNSGKWYVHVDNYNEKKEMHREEGALLVNPLLVS